MLFSQCFRCKTTIVCGGVVDVEGRQYCRTSCMEMGASIPGQQFTTSENDTVVYCWPYCQSADGQVVKTGTDPVFAVITFFGCILMLTLAITYHFNVWSNFYMLWKVVPFLLIPLFSLGRGTTHIRINESGIRLESSAGKSLMGSKPIYWKAIRRIYVEAPKNKSVLSGKLVIEHHGTDRIPLSKIASADQWRKLVQAINTYSTDTQLDSRLLDVVAGQNSRDSSYTRLWLDALTAPPRRERLQPLSAGTSLQSGGFIIERILGSGGQGSAYLAKTKSDSVVVLKEYILPVYVDLRVRKQALEDFENEARLLTSLQHEGIVKSVASFAEDHRAYLVLEYISGKSLRDIVLETGRLAEADCLNYAIQMCKVLSYLHTQSPPLVHRDFTPDNLLVCNSTGRLKLIDFMVAQQEGAESTSVVGKLHYMPPEQFQGKAAPVSDLYAMGCTMHYLLTGQDPEPMTPSHPILLNDAVTPEIDEIVARLTAVDARFRYRDTAELLADLHARCVVNSEAAPVEAERSTY